MTIPRWVPWVAAAVSVSLLSGCTLLTGGPGAFLEEIQEGVNEAVPAIKVGECTDLEIPPGGDDAIQEILTVDCTKQHKWEAYAVTTVDEGDGNYPGQATVQEKAETFCLQQFETFVGAAYDKSTYGIIRLYPTDTSWEYGDRNITCLAGRDEGDITGTLAGIDA